MKTVVASCPPESFRAWHQMDEEKRKKKGRGGGGENRPCPVAPNAGWPNEQSVSRGGKGGGGGGRGEKERRVNLAAPSISFWKFFDMGKGRSLPLERFSMST